MSPPFLFSKYDVISLVTKSLEERVKKHVDRVPSEHVLKISEEDLAVSILSKIELKIPSLLEEDIHFDQEEIQVDARRFAGNRMFRDPHRPHYVPGTRVRVRIPFEGDADVFHIRPTYWTSSGRPIGEIQQREVVLTYDQQTADGAAIKKRYVEAVAEIKKHLESLQKSFDGFNNQIQPIIRSQLKQRRDTLIAAESLGRVLGLPERKSPSAPVTYSIDLKKLNRPTINLPVKTSPHRAEPVLSQTDYEYVLRVMQLMSETMEKAPKSFASMDEEAIRDNFLVHINAQYDGMASGEAFNFAGKTDILLKVDGKCVFIAECKFWTGEKGLMDTIDQLLGYLSWRDTKVAVVVLNRNKNFTLVLRTIQQVVPKHKCYVRTLGIYGESTFNYDFHQPNDKDRKIALTIMAFDVPN